MWYWQDALAWYGRLSVGLATVVVSCLVLWCILRLARSRLQSDAVPDRSRARPTGLGEILTRRLARGEIDIEECGRRLEALGYMVPASFSTDEKAAHAGTTEPASPQPPPHQSNHG